MRSTNAADILTRVLTHYLLSLFPFAMLDRSAEVMAFLCARIEEVQPTHTETLVTIILLHRLSRCDFNKTVLSNAQTIAITSLYLSLKLCRDDFYYQSMEDLETRTELKRAEREFLHIIDYNLYISTEQYRSALTEDFTRV